MAWTFNRDYNDLSQVAEFWDAYNERFEELRSAGKYPYNAEFFDLPGIAEAEKPETPVYLLQGLRRLVEGHDAIARDVSDGCRVIVSASEPRSRFERVVVYDEHYNRAEYAGARIMADERGRLIGVIPKGKRTHGRRLLGNERVLAAD